jgi:hypothetical protein
LGSNLSPTLYIIHLNRVILLRAVISQNSVVFS